MGFNSGFKGLNMNIFLGTVTWVGQGSVDIAIRYGLDGPGIESRWGAIFSVPSRLALVPTQPPVLWVPGVFPRGKAAGAWH